LRLPAPGQHGSALHRDPQINIALSSKDAWPALALKHVRRFIAALTRDFRVHRVGRKVNFSGPRDHALVDENLIEETGIVQWGKNASQFFLLQTYVPTQSVLKTHE
jgi:hypothetical protein